ncbi:trigger factor [Aestuariicoccus sp. KMU-90]|uniref:Trigger factor n=2 Tax=Thetidibacter halocola TaxID=2827239 RepID=A0A8J8B710_9RHOB|nr:DUF6314 family protein [Thetidibacter halocola]MBS0123917.1 trigger factor [Thetidibacter halocola]
MDGQARRRQLADFLGDWQIARDIRHADGSAARFEGRATWWTEGDGAICLESGTLILPGQGAFQAERRYLWAADLSVRFDDGRFFHAVPPEGGQAAHWCDPDQYDADYDFSAWPDWSCTWRVRGPRKDYTMSSRYRRAAA